MRTVVFPYDRDFIPILEAKDLICRFEIARLVSFPGWGARLPEGVFNVDLCTDINRSLDQCDVLWIVNSWNPCSFYELILPMVDQAVARKMHIFITRDLSRQELEEIYAVAGELVIPISTFFNDEKIQEALFSSLHQLSLSYIEAPVICVTGVAQNTGKFQVQSYLKRQFEESDYRVLWISSRKEAITMGGYPLPEFLGHEKVCENQKILLLNNYISILEQSTRPDLIIIGVPGALMLYSKRYAKDFGATAFRIFQALTPDILLVGSLFINNLDNDYFEQLETEILSRYSCEVDYHFISAYSVDFQTSEAKKEMAYLTLNGNFVLEQLRSIRRGNVFPLMNCNGKNIYTKILRLLTQETSTIV